jgi:hypothetical protein
MTRYEAFNNMCFMGRTELDGLQAPPDWAFLRANASKVYFVFNRDDYWAPLWLKVRYVYIYITPVTHTAR